MRLFLGIELPENIKQEIYHFLLPLHKTEKQWVPAHDYHQTMFFFGETTEDQLTVIKERMALITFPAFNLTTSEFKFFSRRIMYLDFMPSTDLAMLHQKVQEVFPEWVRPDEKKFLPHVTVKRWQRYEYDALVNGIKNRTLPPMKFNVSSLALFKSEADLKRNKYHVIHRTQLASTVKILK